MNYTPVPRPSVEVVSIRFLPEILAVSKPDGEMLLGGEVVKVSYAADICEECGTRLEPGMYPFCRGEASRHGERRYYRIEPYEVELDGQKVVIDSIQMANKLEREASARGQFLAFRVFHQDSSNLDKNCFSSMNPRPEFSTKDRRGNPYVTAAQKAGIEASAAPIVKKLMGGWD